MNIEAKRKDKISTSYNPFLNKYTFKSWAAWIILGAGIALTLLVTIYTRHNIEVSTKQEFASICSDMEVKLDTRLHSRAQLLRSGAAFFEATDSVSRMKWKAFNDAAKINKDLPGIQGLGYSIIISKDQLQQHIEGIRNEGFPDYTVKPAGQRDIYTSIIYLEPFTGRNLRALGYDMFSEPVRRKAMEQSRDENVAMISGKVSLVQETNQDVQPGTLMYVPVYKIGKPINTIAQRREAIKGWVYSPYRMKDLMEGILGRWDLKQLERIQLRVYDDSVTMKSLLYDSQLSDSLKDKGFISQTVVKPVTFNGKQWVLSFTQYNQAFWMQNETVVVFAAGIVVSILLFLLFGLLSNTKRRAELLAQNLTAELKESASLFENLFEKHGAIMLLIEPETGTILNANEAAIEFYGYPKAELFAKSIYEFNTLGIDEKIKIRKKIILGEVNRLQLQHRLKDGTIHNVEIHASTVHYNKQSLIFAIVNDITESLQTQEKIRESEERFRTMAINAPALIWMSGTDTLCNYFNQTWLNFTGRTLEQEMGNGWAEGVHPDDLQSCLDIYMNSFNARQSFLMEYRLRHADGTYHWLLDNGIPRFTASGIFMGYIGSCMDINHSKQASIIANEALDRLQKIASRVPGVVYQYKLNPDGTSCFPYASESIKEIYRVTPEEAREDASKVFAIIHPDDLAGVTESIQLSAKDLTPWQYDYRVKFNDGIIRWMHGNAIPEKQADGSILWHGFIADVTERKEMELEREQFFKFFNISSDLMVIADPMGCFKKINSGGLKMLGYTEEELLTKPFVDFIYPEDRQATIEEMERQMKAGSTFNFENRYMCKDGSIKHFLWCADYNDIDEMTYATARDISDRKKIEEKLLRSEDRLQFALEVNNTGVWELNLNDHTAFRTPKHDLIFGYKELLPTWTFEMFLEHVLPEHRQMVETSFNNAAALQIDWNFECRIKRMDGEIRWVLVKGTHSFNADEKTANRILGVVQDITERKNADEKIKQLSQAIEQSPLSIVITDTTGLIEYANPKFEEITGYTLAEALGKNPSILKSGNNTAHEYGQLWKTITSGKDWHGEFLNRKKNGDLYWESASISPIINTEGAITHFLAIKEDITDRKAAEEVLNHYAEDLKKSNAELEDFAYVASHDLQEPLRMISGFLTLLDKKYNSKLDETGRQYINFATDGAARMRRLILDLLQYSRVGTNKEEFTSVDLNEIMVYVTRVLKETVEANKAIITINPMPVITANRTLINELFVNLFTNALKYRGEKDPVIELGYTEGTKEYTFFVKDNGIGINEAYYEKIFVIFQRLHGKNEYSGTGIGLALCKKIVDTHKGKIWVESVEGKGSSFYFSIPKK